MAFEFPYRFGGSSARMPPPRRLTFEELLEQLKGPEAAMPPRPEMYDSLQDLPPEDRRRGRLDSLFSGLAALGSGMQSGQVSRSLQGGLDDIRGVEDQAIGRANAQQAATYERQVQEAKAGAQAAEKQRAASAIWGMFERVTEGEEPGSPFFDRAEAAAKAGSMSELGTMAREKPQRDAATARGWNPDAWDTITKMNEELKAETERANAAKAWEGEKARLTEKERIEAEAETAKRLAQRKAGVLWEPQETPAEAAAKADAVEKIRAKYREGGAGVAGGRLFKQGEKIVYAKPPTAEDPDGIIVPLEGQPENVGNLVFYTLPGGIRMMQDKGRPELGAVQMPQKQTDEEGYEDTLRKMLAGGKAAPGGDAFNPKNPDWKPEDSLQAIETEVGRTLPPNVRAEVLKDLKAGRKPREIKAEILRDNPSWKRR